ncbi:MAG: coiled-coil domain-containing protein 22 [Candidatus Cloacimonetes bacterium]|nr:coiled-coil domain-containing protein 22 [Candidatus Cloacimonadota bacterium]
MESPILNLQERLQKLIDQYTADKKVMEELKKQVAQLSEENMQLFAQVEEYSKLSGDADANLKALQKDYDALKAKNEEFEKMLFGIESFADDAIKKIDNIFPLLEDGE